MTEAERTNGLSCVIQKVRHNFVTKTILVDTAGRALLILIFSVHGCEFGSARCCELRRSSGKCQPPDANDEMNGITLSAELQITRSAILPLSHVFTEVQLLKSLVMHAFCS